VAAAAGVALRRGAAAVAPRAVAVALDAVALRRDAVAAAPGAVGPRLDARAAAPAEQGAVGPGLDAQAAVQAEQAVVGPGPGARAASVAPDVERLGLAALAAAGWLPAQAPLPPGQPARLALEQQAPDGPERPDEPLGCSAAFQHFAAAQPAWRQKAPARVAVLL